MEVIKSKLTHIIKEEITSMLYELDPYAPGPTVGEAEAQDLLDSLEGVEELIVLGDRSGQFADTSWRNRLQDVMPRLEDILDACGDCSEGTRDELELMGDIILDNKEALENMVGVSIGPGGELPWNK